MFILYTNRDVVVYCCWVKLDLYVAYGYHLIAGARRYFVVWCWRLRTVMCTPLDLTLFSESACCNDQKKSTFPFWCVFFFVWARCCNMLCFCHATPTQKAALFACLTSGWATTTGRLLGPKVGNSIKCLSQVATFWLLARRLYQLSHAAAGVCVISWKRPVLTKFDNTVVVCDVNIDWKFFTDCKKNINTEVYSLLVTVLCGALILFCKRFSNSKLESEPKLNKILPVNCNFFLNFTPV